MLTLIVPGLVWPRQALADLTHGLPLPGLALLLGKARVQRGPPRDTAEILAEVAGLNAPLPVAALRQLALGEHPGDADWLCLDPVGLRFAEGTLVVGDPRQLNLTAGEAAALAASLAPTLAELGTLQPLSPEVWNLRLAAGAPDFAPLPEAIGRGASALPLGAAHAPWRRAINEAQMLLHSHPVNQAREAAGQPTVNSLWPWGGGRLPAGGDSAGRHEVLWSDDPTAQGIARLLRIGCAALPPRFETGRRTLALVDALGPPARAGDALAWRDAIERFEADWLAPALGALRGGRLDGLRLLAPSELAALDLQLGRHDLWKFWRKPVAPSELGPP